MPDIRLEKFAEEAIADAPSDGSAALQRAEEPLLTLRLRVCAPEPAGLDALRHARRSMLREEWTLGGEPGEPSLETAVFSPTEVVWTVPRSCREWCLERLSELERRANRAFDELRRP
ncbi:MAG: hypothetical protein ACRD3M_01920 [Thermoanaerobaculia bacterium]